MTRPENLFEAASYDLNKFRERRMAERRAQPRGTPDRRVSQDSRWIASKDDGSAADSGKTTG
ncbi:MAG TPA: hypothetical protein VJ652_05280 [Noviherbaspirillum sp.]|nr:hypothetical protein [Noviherbaspirillum sp.]